MFLQIVKFKNLSNNEFYEYQIPTTETEQLAACVMLFRKDTEVEIYTDEINDWQF
jgi:hypothetical protein